MAVRVILSSPERGIRQAAAIWTLQGETLTGTDLDLPDAADGPLRCPEPGCGADRPQGPGQLGLIRERPESWQDTRRCLLCGAELGLTFETAV